MREKIIHWCLLGAVSPLAIPSALATDVRPIRVCETVLSHQGMIRLEPALHEFLPQIRRFAFQAEAGHRVSAWVNVHADTDHDIVANARLDLKHPLAVRFPTITRPSNLLIEVRHTDHLGGFRAFARRYFLREWTVADGTSLVLAGELPRNHGPDLATLFIAMSMTPAARQVVIHIPLSGVDLGGRIERVLRSDVQDIEYALFDLDIPELTEFLGLMPLPVVSVHLVDKGRRLGLVFAKDAPRN